MLYYETMQSIEKIRASDGSGNASVATVQTLRSSGASTIIVDTVDGINGSFVGSMGTPNTYVDPITAEEITVISEATAVDFSGHVDGTNLEIDDIAPGYTDNGSQVGDIVVIRPTTQWSDNVADVLAVALEDDGTLKDNAVTTAKIADSNVTTAKVADASVTPAKLDSNAIGHGYLEIGRTTLGSAGDTISIASIPAYKYLRVMVLCMPTGGTMTAGLRFNNDSSANYAQRFADNDSADGTAASASAIFLDVGAETTNVYSVADVVNVSSINKLVIASSMCEKSTSVATIPTRRQSVAKWANTAAQITRVDVVNSGTGDFAIGSELIVYGHN